MDAVVEFFRMGGYAFYVWGAYGMTFTLIAVEVAWLVWRSRHKRVRQEEQRRPVRPQWRRQT